MKFEVLCGDNVVLLSNIAGESIDACITDPPYGMGMEDWDHAVPPRETWKSVYRVLKPGAFVLSFCSPELYHRMAVNVEDAGFTPKDMLFWVVTTKMAKHNRLKPAHEPIMVAQKPYSGSLKANVSKWGCGAVNIDAGRVPWEKEPPKGWVRNGYKRRTFGKAGSTTGNSAVEGTVDANPAGRYPSNVVGLFDDSEHQKYFYAPRVTRSERGENNDHPTPKPIALMRWLVRLYSPMNGTVLDPFNGSGSTGLAVNAENRDYIGMELSQHYCDITMSRFWNKDSLFVE